MRPWWLIAAGLVVIVAALAIIFLPRGADDPAGTASATLPPEVSVEEAYNRFQDGAYLLDVRTTEEWNEFHVEGSTLIPLNELSARMSEVPKDQEVVIVCRSGNRSAQARDLLAGAGFSQVTSVAGGLTDWRSSGYPTVSGP
jgi:rhodanese-related sulfurtransferase